MEEHLTKGERREEKKGKRRKMRVVGRNVRLLMDIIRNRAQKAKRNEKLYK
jgi:hypothetical protein